MGGISGTLITVRSAKQGAEMMRSKMTAEYAAEIATLRINPEDMADLAVSEGDQARIVSAHGEVVVTCDPTDVPRRTFFLPLGPLANQLFSGQDTEGTGVPNWKRLPVTVEACKARPGGEHDSAAEVRAV